MISPDLGEGDLFGGSVSISDKNIVVGDENFPAGMATGSAYVYPIALLPVGISDDIKEIPTNFVLHQNYPDPFNPSTTIEYTIARPEFITLRIFNVLGEQITTMVAEQQAPGKYKVQWLADDFTSGIYFYRLTAGNFSETKKLVLLK